MHTSMLQLTLSVLLVSILSNSNKESGTTGGYPARMANSELTWETSEQLDLGFDARFLNQRLGVNFDYYVKKTKDLLLDVPISAVNGFATQMANAGSVKNTGVELALSWNDRIGKDFSYNVGWNIATNKNEVTEVNNGSGYINGAEALLLRVQHLWLVWRKVTFGLLLGL